MLLVDPETEIMYEVEIMLGATDPSHIIRTIEYWDIESRRYPSREHRAVIVAEEITNRFFNVIWLLNRSLPIIAIQVDALKFEGKLLLNFTKVLDIYESPEGPEEQAAAGADRKYWETRSSPAAMQIFDRFIKTLSEHSIEVKLNWRQDGIALAGKWNFARITPRKTGHCLLRFFDKLPEDVMKDAREKLEEAGAAVQTLTGNRFSVRLDTQTLDRSASVLVELAKRGVAQEGE
jgi:hypothetical protein